MVENFVAELLGTLGGLDRLTAAQVGLIVSARGLLKSALELESVENSAADPAMATKVGRSAATVSNAFRHVLADIGAPSAKPPTGRRITGIQDLLDEEEELVPPRRAH
jgi:hypothetical protein